MGAKKKPAALISDDFPDQRVAGGNAASAKLYAIRANTAGQGAVSLAAALAY